MNIDQFDHLMRRLASPGRSVRLPIDRVARIIGGAPLPRRHALKAVAALALAAPLGYLAAPEPALAARQQTATCNPPPSSTGNATLVLSGDDRLAQTFVPELGGKLSRVVQIAEVNAAGTPTNRILATTTVPSTTLPVNTAALVAAKFRRRGAAKVVAGTPYAIVVQRQGAANLFLPLRTDDPCPEGAVFKSLSKTDPFEAECNGTFDLPFTAFVGYA